ncbi:MAG: PIG-L family deacetylase [Chloroflexaceae bacterium]|nr:PIG-L family deacetylase [Chloroflexaceae bacterium]
MAKPAANVRPTLLAVLAHPDDETFGTGGTLAFYAWCGADVYVICATGGEEGSVDEHHMAGYASVAALREAELTAAAAELGLKGVHLLGYRDSGMPGAPSNQHPQALAAAPPDEVAARVTQLIRQLRPHVVITFDPIGGYRHPDHIAIQRAAVRAFHAAGDADLFPGHEPAYQPQKLYFHTFSRRFLRLVVRLMPLFGRDPARFGRNHDVDLASIAREEFSIHARIDFLPVADRRAAASARHASQGGGSMLLRGPLGLLFRLLGGHETYMRAFPPAPPGLQERDLFVGVAWPEEG